MNIENIQPPDSPLAIDSQFYIERPPCELRAYQHITQPGSIIRIKAPSKMGKSSLMLRLMNYGVNLGYKIVFIDFQQADLEIFANSHKFLRWLCRHVTRQLQITANMDDYWDEDMGSKVSCTIYFEECLLPALDQPLVLVFNEVNRLFQYTNIAQDFLPLLRFWHEQARQVKDWQKLRLILVHSTEVYVSLSINQSPFNVGLVLELPEFTLLQVQELARRYQLNYSSEEINQLNQMVGGHPYLIHLALYHLYVREISLEKLLKDAPTQNGIYNYHLRNLWITLQKKPELASAMHKIVNQENGIQFEPLISYQLHSMGLIKIEGNLCKYSCNLYKIYFSSQGLVEEMYNTLYIQNLKQENEKLNTLVYVDSLTKIANRLQFDKSFQMEWECMAIKNSPLSLIICDVDYFKIYNDLYGHQLGDDCLYQVAQGIKSALQRPGDFLARYGGEEFVIILPETDANGAILVSEKIRESVKKLAITTKNNTIVTVSLGVASIIPSSEYNPKMLFIAADQALYDSKKTGRDRVTLSSIFNFTFQK